MKVAIIQGGRSSEAEVSRVSALCVENALRKAGHKTKRVELGPETAVELRSFAPEVVFPAVHGSQGEDGCLQGLLEILELPYVGSDVRGSALAADKVSSKVFFRSIGLRVAQERILSESNQRDDQVELFDSIRGELGPCLVVKPAQGGSTLGISRIRAEDGVEVFTEALERALSHDPQVLIEQFIVGQEVTCSILHDETGLRSLPVTLLKARASDWMDFRSKYQEGGAEHLCPAPLTPDLYALIQQISLSAHQVLGLRDLSRADFIVGSDGVPVILEVNTLPGLTDVSLFPEAAQAAGISFPVLLDSLVKGAVARTRRVPSLAEPLPGR